MNFEIAFNRLISIMVSLLHKRRMLESNYIYSRVDLSIVSFIEKIYSRKESDCTVEIVIVVSTRRPNIYPEKDVQFDAL